MVMMTQWAKKRNTRTLVLGRKENESILIGNDIRVTVMQIRGNRTKLVIQAPEDVRVLRSEIADNESSSDAG